MDLQTYYEKNLVINNRELRYKGIFRFDELVSAINHCLESKHYHGREKRTEELVTEEGKRSYIELRPLKYITKYVKVVIKIKITVDKATQIIEEVQGMRRKFDNGEVLIAFDAWVLSDYGHRWGMKPTVYFLKSMINKYIYTFPLEGSAPGEVAADTAFVYASIKKLFNSYKEEVGKVPSEAEVMKNVELEIQKEMEGEKEF